MQTNKVINIPFMGTTIQQQTEGGLIDISVIVDIVNAKRLKQGKEEKRVNDYFENNQAQEYLSALVEDMRLKELTRNSASVQVIEIIDEQRKITIKELKGLRLYKDTRGKYAGTWFTPLLAIDIVGWLDAEIRLNFNKIVMQQLFQYRIDMSNNIRKLTDLIVEKFGKQDSLFFTKLNIDINKKVYGEHYPDIRNDIDTDNENFKKVIKLINRIIGYIDDEIIEAIEDIPEIIKKIKSL